MLPFFRYGPYLPAHMALCGLGPIYPRQHFVICGVASSVSALPLIGGRMTG